MGQVRKCGVLDGCGLEGGRRARAVLIGCVVEADWGNHPKLAQIFEDEVG